MLFDGPRAELPIATLEPAVRGRRMRADFHRWRVARWAWLRPRIVPLLVACGGLFAILGAVKAVGRWSHEAPLRLPVRTELSVTPPHHADYDQWRYARLRAGHDDGPEPVRLLIRPIAQGDRYIELTIGETDPR